VELSRELVKEELSSIELSELKSKDLGAALDRSG